MFDSLQTEPSKTLSVRLKSRHHRELVAVAREFWSGDVSKFTREALSGWARLGELLVTQPATDPARDARVALVRQLLEQVGELLDEVPADSPD